MSEWLKEHAWKALARAPQDARAEQGGVDDGCASIQLYE
jgi:hypothetical protein